MNNCKDCLFWSPKTRKKYHKRKDVDGIEKFILKNVRTNHEILVRFIQINEYKDYFPVSEEENDSMYDDKLDLKGRWGWCSGIPFRYNLIDPETKNQKEVDYYLNKNNTNAICEDGSAYSANVVTLETFGCNNFKERN